MQSLTSRWRPLIGIGCDVAAGPPAMVQLRLDYSDAVSDAGGAPLLLPPSTGEEELERVLSVLDGLLFSGGPDYDPSIYGQGMHRSACLQHPLRGKGDLLLARRALKSRRPVLGICGGLQLINIALGGDLIQDIPEMVPAAKVHAGPPGGPPAPHHRILIESGTLLARLVGREDLSVNSFHHQAAGRLGSGLRVSARAEDGVVEAVEAENGRFLLGVQWHPERDGADPNRALFAGLVEAARASRERRS